MSGTVQVLKAALFFLLGCLAKGLILTGGNYFFLDHVLYYTALVYIVHRYATSYKLPKLPDNSLSVVVVGAGISGVAMAIKLKELGVKFRIIEKEKQLGGTWWLNRYPGVCCDVPSHMYSYSFALNPDWSRSFSTQAEILRYVQGVAKKYKVAEHIEFGKRVVTSTWDDGTQLWTLTLDDGEVMTANVVISSVGALHVPMMPKFAGAETFKGRIFHSAEWPGDYDPQGERVAVIGTGATSVQIVPAIVDKVSHVTVLQRTPCWVPPKDDFQHPAWLKRIFSVYPPAMHLVRLLYFLKHELSFYLTFRIDSRFRNYLVRQIAKHYEHVVTDPATREKLKPKFEMGCKRVTPSNTYLQSFNRDNVSLLTEGIQAITEEGIQTKDGIHHKFDTIIYATGFDLIKSSKSVTVFGRNKDNNHKENGGKAGSLVSLGDEWGDEPNAYMGIVYPGYPNSFGLLGPGTGLGHNSIIFMIECQVNYITEAIRVMVHKNIKSLEVKKEVNEKYQQWSQKCMENKVFNSPSCFSWYKNKSGVNYALWPSHLTHYWRVTKNIDLADYTCVM